MGEQGKYHGQRLKAREVLRLYAAGERDFRGAILRGGNFRRADLSGADFSGADIRSARFVEATLRGAKFCHAQAGLQRRWWLGQMALVIVISVLAGSLQGFAGAWIGSLLTNSDQAIVLTGVAGLIIITIVFFAISHQGFTLKALGSFAVSVVGAFALGVLGAGFSGVRISVSVSVVGAVAVFSAFAVIGVVAIVSALAFTVGVIGAFTIGVAVVVGITVGISHAVASTVAVTVAVTVASLLLSIYVDRRIHKFESKFENLRIIGLAVAALGGTRFSGADLTSTTFAHARLKSTNFADSRQRPTTLTQVRWHQAQKLDRARLGSSALQDHRVRLLLTTLNGIDQDLSNADLRGANLAGAQLHRANLKAANLNGATLEAAELHSANLAEAQCLGTNFTSAHLTGACLEAWNIDETTILQNIDCLHVFLKEQPDARGNRERRPHNPDKDFQPGDFEKLFKEMLDTVQILIRNGVNPESFKAALQHLMENHPGITADSIQGFERKGEDVLVTLQVPEGTDKGKIEQVWEEVYAARLQAATTQARLEAEQRRADDVKEVALGFSKFLSSIQINNMNNPINTGDGSFYAGRDVNLTGSTLNLGEISGQVSNQINQLPDVAPEPGKPSLKDLLTQLQQAVESDPELSEVEKKEALGEVAKLAEAGSNPKENAMQRMAKRAADTLKSITEPLTEASNLAEACKTLLPLILAIF